MGQNHVEEMDEKIRTFHRISTEDYKHLSHVPATSTQITIKNVK